VKHEWRLILVFIALLSVRASAGTVELRRAVRVDAGADVTLADVAVLSGDDALALGGIVVIGVADPALARGNATVEIDRVRAIIHIRGVNWGLLTLRGGRCDVSVRETSVITEATIRSLPAPAASPPTGPTVRTFVEQRLRETFGVTDPTLLRIRFEDRDEDLLSMALTDRLVEAHTAGSSERVPVSVSVYEGDRLIERRQIRVEVLIEREVCVLKAPVRRGTLLSEGDFITERRWMPTDVRPLTLADANGAEARSALDAGTVLNERHVEAPVVIRRGGLAMVHYLSGGVILKTRARAMSDGRMGERIRFEVLGTRRRFMANVDGPDRAVVRRDTKDPGLVTPSPTQTDTMARPDALRPGIEVTRAE